jgi:heat shock protein HspQ
MPNVQQLPALLRLFDDRSETVRRAVLGELAAWGDQLEAAVLTLDEVPSSETLAALLAAVAEFETAPPDPPPTTSEPAQASSGEVLFRPGQLVRHVHYGYRGVVVACDESCEAPDEWYYANRTRPERSQPWYHVLVHDSPSVTYAAETSLKPDDSDDDVRHPLVSMFFDGKHANRYRRNDRPWPPAQP